MTEETKTPKRGVGTVIKERLLAGATNQDALEAAKAEFPGSETSLQTVSWYRSSLRKQGEKVPTAHEARAAAAQKELADAKPADPLDD